MTNATWNRAVAAFESVCEALLLATVLFVIIAAVLALGALIGG